jgi:hypothetical protein
VSVGTLIFALLLAASPQDTCLHEWEREMQPRVWGLQADGTVQVDSVPVFKFYYNARPDSVFVYIRCEKCRKRVCVFDRRQPGQAWRDSINAVIDSLLDKPRKRK